MMPFVSKSLREICSSGRFGYLKLFFEQYRDQISQYELDVALIICSDIGHKKAIPFLIEQKADISYNEGECLLRAVEKGHTGAVEILISHKADVNSNPKSYLRTASQKGHTKIVRMLVDAKADIRANGDEALEIAAMYHRVDTCKLLIEYGAQVRFNGTAIRTVVGGENPQLIRLILDHKADLNCYDGIAAMNHAFLRGSKEVISILLEYKADVRKLSRDVLCKLVELWSIQSNKDAKAFIGALEAGYTGLEEGIRLYCSFEPFKTKPLFETILQRIQFLIYHGVEYSHVKGLTSEHFYLRRWGVLPLIHERLKVYERDTGDELLDMKPILYHILQFGT